MLEICAGSDDISVGRQRWHFPSECCTWPHGARDTPSKSVTEREWSRFCSRNDGACEQFVAKHVFWHLCTASAFEPDGARKTILRLLTNFLWLCGRWAAYGRASVVRDRLDALSARDGSNKSGSLFSVEENDSFKALRQILSSVDNNVSLESDGKLANALVQLITSSGEGGGIFFCRKDFGQVSRER